MKNVFVGVGLCLLSMSANAALVSRAGGQAYYDDVLNITSMDAKDGRQLTSTHRLHQGTRFTAGFLRPILSPQRAGQE